MSDVFEIHTFGGRLGAHPVEPMLAGMDLSPVGEGEPVRVEVLDHGEAGIWLRGAGPEIGALAPRLASESGRAVRHYRVRALLAEGLVRVEVDGATWWPDGRRVPIRAVEDRFDEEPSGDPAELAAQALSVTLEVHEPLHHEDRSIVRWGGRFAGPAAG